MVRRYPKRVGAFRSQFERRLFEGMESSGVAVTYEAERIPYFKPERLAHYTPDFILANGLVIEAKGLFDADDRAKHLLLKAQYPDLDVRFVFQRNRTLSKASRTTYGEWCDRHGFTWAEGSIPLEWLTP